MLLAVRDVLLSDAAHQRVARVAVGEEGADGEKHFGDGEGRGPVVLEDVQTDGALTVDVAVIDACTEQYLRWFERIFWREMYVQEENAALVDGPRWS